MTGDVPIMFLLAQEGAPGPVNPVGLFTLLPWIAIGFLFYFLLWRPERKKRADLEAMLSRLKKNDRVVTAGGLLGTVVQANQGAEDVTLKVDENNNTRIRVLRSSISRVVTGDNGSDSS